MDKQEIIKNLELQATYVSNAMQAQKNWEHAVNNRYDLIQKQRRFGNVDMGAVVKEQCQMFAGALFLAGIVWLVAFSMMSGLRAGAVVVWCVSIAIFVLAGVGAIVLIVFDVRKTLEDQKYWVGRSFDREENLVNEKRAIMATHYERAKGVDGVAPSYFHALPEIIRYFKNGRADTVKEAINLYEKETREKAFNEAAVERDKAMMRAIGQIRDAVDNLDLSVTVNTETNLYIDGQKVYPR